MVPGIAVAVIKSEPLKYDLEPNPLPIIVVVIENVVHFAFGGT
jgi:hypothetical protein